MQHIIYDTTTYDLLAWIDTESQDIVLKKGVAVISSQEDLGKCVLEPYPPIRNNMMVIPEAINQEDKEEE